MPDDQEKIEADLDQDGDVESDEFGDLKRWLAGENNRGDPTCND